MAISKGASETIDRLGLAYKMDELEVGGVDVTTRAGLVSVGNANYTILASNSGKTHVIANVSADRTFTLPAVSVGLEFKFITSIVAADDADWIFDTGSDTNYFTGGLVFLDTDGELVVTAAGNGSSNSILQVNVPDAGTTIEMICDGTLWVLSGHINSITAPAFANQS